MVKLLPILSEPTGTTYMSDDSTEQPVMTGVMIYASVNILLQKAQELGWLGYVPLQMIMTVLSASVLGMVASVFYFVISGRTAVRSPAAWCALIVSCILVCFNLWWLGIASAAI